MAFLCLSFRSHMLSLLIKAITNLATVQRRYRPHHSMERVLMSYGNTACSRRYVVAAIFGKYNLSQQGNYSFSKAKNNGTIQ